MYACVQIDLICYRDDTTLVVQCKRLSKTKEIPVRENTIAQTYGAARFYSMKHNIDNIKPVIVTSYMVSDEAREFATYLNVHCMEGITIESYPMIKCNTSKSTGEKIYHLPMDQQYDNINIKNNNNSFYAYTVEEAVKKGYRRAFKWKSSS
ncbi:MAG: hypothetical protein RBR54_06080 [Sulfurimonas sp.]|nr:hypothetical protein [Sulfurimonas sp.]